MLCVSFVIVKERNKGIVSQLIMDTDAMKVSYSIGKIKRFSKDGLRFSKDNTLIKFIGNMNNMLVRMLIFHTVRLARLQTIII